MYLKDNFSADTSNDLLVRIVQTQIELQNKTDDVDRACADLNSALMCARVAVSLYRTDTY